MKKKILLVDDSKTSIFLARTLLGRGRFHLIEANDGVEALEKAGNELPDLILMDMVMPRMDGLEALRRLRRQPATAGIPVVMVTTRSEADRVDEAFSIGCSDYVTKPVDQGDLLKKVNHILGVNEAGANG